MHDIHNSKYYEERKNIVAIVTFNAGISIQVQEESNQQRG